jgi:hypothetical protein
MTEKPELIHVDDITGTTLFEDGRIALDIRDRLGNARVLEFKPEMQGHLLRCLLPRGSAMTAPVRGFPAEQAELLQSPLVILQFNFSCREGCPSQ